MNWTAAQGHCRQLGAQLLSLHSQESVSFDHLISLGVKGGEWLALRVSHSRLWWEFDQFALPDMKDLERFTWYGKKPNFTEGFCVQVTATSRDTSVAPVKTKIEIRMAPCERLNRFVCYSRNRVVQLTRYHLMCPISWVFEHNSGNCYLVANSKKNFTQASEHCRKLDSLLIAPVTEFDKMTVFELYLVQAMEFFKTEDFYVGLQKVEEVYVDVNGNQLELSYNISTEDLQRKNDKVEEDEDEENSDDQFAITWPNILREPSYDSDLEETETTTTHEDILEVNKLTLNCVKGSALSGRQFFASDCMTLRNHICQRPSRSAGDVRLFVQVEDDSGKLIQPVSLDNSGVSLYKLSFNNYSTAKVVCHVRIGEESGLWSKSIIWMKDNIYLDQVTSSVLTLGKGSFLLGLEENQYNFQGNYSCATWLNNSALIYSNPALILRDDFITLRVYAEKSMWFDSKDMYSYILYNSLYLNEPFSCIKHCHTYCYCFNLYTGLRMDENGKGKPVGDIKYNFYINITGYEIISKEEFFKFPAYLKLSRPEAEREWELYSIKEGLKTAIKFFTAERDNGKILGFTVKSSRGCSNTTLTVNETEVRFGMAHGNEQANSTTSCLTDGLPPMALGLCKGDFDRGFSWEILHFYDCFYEKGRIAKDDPMAVDINKLKDKMDANPKAAVDNLLNFTKTKTDNLTTNIIDILNDLVKETTKNQKTLNEEVGKKTVLVIDNLFNASSKSDGEPAGKSNTIANLAETLENVLAKVELHEGKVTWPNENFVVHMANPEEGAISFGMAAKGDGTNEIPLSGKEVENNTEVTASVFLPREAIDMAKVQTNKTVKANIIVYKRDVFLDRDSTNVNKINSHVIMGSLDGGNVTNLKEKIRLKFQLYEKSDQKPECVYAYNDKVDGKSTVWKWSNEGITTETVTIGDHTVVECLSSHLTNFAVMAGFNLDPVSKIGRALSAISIFGAVFSILCLLLVIIGQILFKKFRKGQFQSALLNLSIALIMVNLLVLLGLDRTSNRRLCMAVAAFLHYFLLVSFSWMLIEAILQYLRFVKVFNTHVSRFLLKACAPAWGIPALIVLAIAVFDHEQFRGPENYCWLDKNAFHFAFLLPLGLIVCTNLVIFTLIIKSISCDRPKGMQTNQTKGRLVWLQVQAGMCCFVVMGLTWSFALFAFGKVALIMQFLFAIFNSLQGFFIFVLFNLREDPVRKAWSKLLKEKFGRPSKVGKKKLISGETYTFNTKTSSSGSTSQQDSSTVSQSDTCETKETKYSMDTISE